jgi:hypothetical protein
MKLHVTPSWSNMGWNRGAHDWIPSDLIIYRRQALNRDIWWSLLKLFNGQIIEGMHQGDHCLDARRALGPPPYSSTPACPSTFAIFPWKVDGQRSSPNGLIQPTDAPPEVHAVELHASCRHLSALASGQGPKAAPHCTTATTSPPPVERLPRYTLLPTVLWWEEWSHLRRHQRCCQISRRRRTDDEIKDPSWDSSFKYHQLMKIDVSQVMRFHHQPEW